MYEHCTGTTRDYANLRRCLTNFFYRKYIYGGTALGNIFLTNLFYFFFRAYIPCKLRKEITGISLNVGVTLGGNFGVIKCYSHFI
jgi:hypothetical protein